MYLFIVVKDALFNLLVSALDTYYYYYRFKVSKRNGSTPCQLRGIFAGAKVVRGPDWDWGNQDGKY